MTYTPKILNEILTPDTISLMTTSMTHAGLDRADWLCEEMDLVSPVFWFSRIKAKIEHRGDGTFLMKKICAYADELKATIVNEINPYGDLSLEELICWFGKFGFKKYNRNVIVRNPVNYPAAKDDGFRPNQQPI